MGRVRVRTRLPPQRPRPVFKPSSRRRAKQRTKTASLARVERMLSAIIASLDHALIRRLIARARRERRNTFTLAVRPSSSGGGGVDEDAVTRALNSLSAADAAAVDIHPYMPTFAALFDVLDEPLDDAADDDDSDDDDAATRTALRTALDEYMKTTFGVHATVIEYLIVIDDVMEN